MWRPFLGLNGSNNVVTGPKFWRMHIFQDAFFAKFVMVKSGRARRHPNFFSVVFTNTKPE